MDIVERLKISQDFGKDVIGVGDFMKGTSVIQEAIYEIQSLRQQLTKPADEVLIEALRKIANAPLIKGTSIQAIATEALAAYKPTEG
jgi:hypothetical protein